jgi:putative transposase
MTETLVGVSPPSPEKNEDQEPGRLEQQEPGGEAFGVVPDAGPDRELTAAELAVIQRSRPRGSRWRTALRTR